MASDQSSKLAPMSQLHGNEQVAGSPPKKGGPLLGVRESHKTRLIKHSVGAQHMVAYPY